MPKVKGKDFGLSVREKEVLRLIWEGHSTKKVASLLKLKYATVEAHRHNIYTKMNVSNATSAIRLALANKILKL